MEQEHENEDNSESREAMFQSLKSRLSELQDQKQTSGNVVEHAKESLSKAAGVASSIGISPLSLASKANPAVREAIGKIMKVDDKTKAMLLNPLFRNAGVGALTAAATLLVTKPNHPVAMKMRELLRETDTDVDAFLSKYLPSGLSKKVSKALLTGYAPASFCYNCGKAFEMKVDVCPDCEKTIGNAICFSCNSDLEWGHEICPKCKKPMDYATLQEVEEKKQKEARINTKKYDEVKNSPVAQFVFKELMGKSSSIFTFDSIPGKKIRNAIQHYADFPADENILALYDSTTFGSAETGIVFTDKRLYWKNNTPVSENARGIFSLRYRDLNEISLNGNKDAFSITINETHRIEIDSKDEAEAICRFLEVCLGSVGLMVPTCKNCGAENEEGAKFCSECGGAMIDEEVSEIVCDKCGAVYAKQVKFCNQCGNILQN